MSSQSRGRTVFFLFGQSIIQAFAYYIFITIIGNSFDAKIVGEGAATVSFAGLISSIVTLGTSSGLLKTFGESIGNGNNNHAKELMTSSMLLISLSISFTIAIILLFPAITSQTQLPVNLILIALITIPIIVYPGLLRVILTSVMQGRIIFLASIVSAIVGIGAGLALIRVGYGSTGVVLGIIIINNAPLLLFSKAAWMWLNTSFPIRKMLLTIPVILRPSISSWIPNIMSVAGLQIGTLVVFANSGAISAGIYFISYALFTAISFVNSSFNSVTLPVMSGMQEGRDKYAFESIRLQLIIVLPLIVMAVFFSDAILGVFGSQYIQGRDILRILVVGLIPFTIASGLRQLYYAEGKNKHILTSGIITDGSRIILLFALVYYLGPQGAAISVSIGSAIALAYYYALSRLYEKALPWNRLIPIGVIPFAFGLIFYYLNLNALAGISLIAISSVISYIRLNLLTKQDMKLVVGTIAPEKYNERITKRADKIIDLIQGGRSRSVGH